MVGINIPTNLVVFNNVSYLFCNVSWMREYRGHRRIDGMDDNPQRGGKWVDENGTAGEFCNFLPDDNGIVFGHVETLRGDQDTAIGIENLGAKKEDAYVDHIDVIWIATHENGGRRVVGWYKGARIYRSRQFHKAYPTHQHQRDELGSYRVVAKKENVYLIPESHRILELGKGEGWPGQSQLFYPEERSKNKEMMAFLKQLDECINGIDARAKTQPITLNFNPESCGQSIVYVQDVRQMRRIHGEVVNALYAKLRKILCNKIIFNNQYIDLAVPGDGALEKLFEVKTENDRQSIYTGIGQLMFHSGADKKIEKILVLPKCTHGYEELYELFDSMGIWISEYFIDENKNICFENLPD